MMMLHVVVVVFGVVEGLGIDATVGPCQQYTSVVNFRQSVIDYSNFGDHTMGPCPWSVVDLEGCRVA